MLILSAWAPMSSPETGFCESVYIPVKQKSPLKQALLTLFFESKGKKTE